MKKTNAFILPQTTQISSLGQIIVRWLWYSVICVQLIGCSWITLLLGSLFAWKSPFDVNEKIVCLVPYSDFSLLMCFNVWLVYLPPHLALYELSIWLLTRRSLYQNILSSVCSNPLLAYPLLQWPQMFSIWPLYTCYSVNSVTALNI